MVKFTDGAHWYYYLACMWLRLKHRIYGTSLNKNLIERFIQYLKDRTECFDDHFLCQKKDCDIQHVWNWLKNVPSYCIRMCLLIGYGL